MSVNIGIIGLSKSGKTTVFNVLTGGAVATTGPHIGVAKVPDERIKILSEIVHPHKITYTEVKYIDIGASSAASSKSKGIGGQLLTELSECDALLNIVRVFVDESIPHESGSLDAERDIAAMNMELAFSDLAIIERRVERIEEQLKAAKAAERLAFAHEQETLAKIKVGLEKEIPVRELQLTAEENKSLANYQFLTGKPLLIIANIGENQLSQGKSIEEKLNSRYSRPNCRVLTFCGKLEMELSQLDAETAAGFRADYGMPETGLERVIRTSYELLGLLTFFTIASGEVRAWPLRTGTEALKAAGKIHTDMERGFIRAEAVSLNDLVKCGSVAEARKKGLLRLEGKTYIVRDGDVITFLFNV